MLINKTLLIVSNGYPSKEGIASHAFVKVQVDTLKKYFKKIVVIAPLPFMPNILCNNPILKDKFLCSDNFKDYSYDNVDVYYPKFYTLMIDYFRKRNGEYVYSALNECIEDNNIEFDLIHAHFTWTSGYAAVKLKEKYDKKVILTTHGLHSTRLKTFISNYDAINTWKKVDVIINVAEEYSKMLTKLKINDNNLKFVPNIVDLKKFKPIKDSRAKLNIVHNKKIILSVGNLVDKKGFEYLIKSIKLLKKQRDDFVCYIIGGGALENKLKLLIKELDLEDIVVMLGARPHDEIPLWMNVADVFVLNSFVESFGVVNIEALACGTPVISTINGGSEYIITKKQYGFIINKPQNTKELANKINTSLNKKYNKKVMIQYAKTFESNNIVKKIIKIYKEEIK